MAESGRSVGSVSVSVVPDASGFVEKLRAELEAGTKSVGDAIGRNIGSSMSDAITPYLEQIRLKLDELGTKEVRIKVRTDDDGSLARVAGEVAAADAAAGSSGDGFNIFGGRIAAIGLAAVAAADVAIPAILAIGAAAAGALAGVAVLGLGFSGIGAALQAHKQTGGGGGGGGGANSGLGLESARIAAAQATRSAQDQLTQAIQTQVAAEASLHDARIQALQDLQDLDNKLKDNTISQAQAAIDLRTAQQTLAVTLNAPGASQAQYSDQVAQARLNVAAAQQKVNELTLEGTRLTAQDATARKDGVDNAPKVVSAQQALVDANHKLAEAQANIGITAQKNAIALQQAAASAAGAAGGVDQFAAAMAKLNPIQQQFVEFLLKMKPLFDQIKLAASQFLPGIEQGFKNAAPAFGPIVKVIGDIAKAMGTVFANIGAQFATPEGQKFLAFLSVELPRQIIFLGGLFIEFGKILSGIFEAAAPLIAAFDKAFLGVITSIGESANGGGLKTFFGSLIPLVQPVLTFLGAVSSLIGKLLIALAPHLPALINAFTDVVNALVPLVPIIAQLVGYAAPVIEFLAPLAPYIVAIVAALGLWEIAQSALNVVLEAGPIGLIVLAIAALVAGFILAYKHSETFRDIVKAVFAVIGNIVSSIVTGFETFGSIVAAVFKAVGDALSWVWANVLKPIFGFIKTVAIDPISTAIHALGTAWKTVWDGIGAAISYVYNHILKPIFGSISTAISTINSALSGLSNSGSALSTAFGFVTGKTSSFQPVPPGTKPAYWTKDDGGWIPGALGVPSLGIGHGGEYVLSAAMLAGRQSIDAGVLQAIAGAAQATPPPDLSNRAASHGHFGAGATNNFYAYEQSDPVATSHAVANRFQARGV